jgi:hypothetical protein
MLRNALTVGPREVSELEVQKLETWMAGSLGVLAAGPAAATTEVECVDGGALGVLATGPVAATIDVGDVDGGPPRGCCRHVRQWPPLKLKTSIGDPLGGAGGRAGSGHHRS